MSQHSIRIAIVILNWNGRSYLEKFLPGVLQHSSHLARVIVADNASSDDSLHLLETKFPEVERIVLDKNRGFTGGYNAALKQVDSEYYVLLNSDVEVTAGWLEPMLSYLDNHPLTAACQPKILNYQLRDEFEYAGAGGGFIDKLGYPFCRGRIFTQLEKDLGQYDEDINIFWASGASMMIRSENFHSIGAFDEDFFAHMEEIDLCWRIQKAGFLIRYCHQSVVYHVGGGTLPKSNPRKTYLNFRNNLFLLFKNLEPRHFSKILIFRTILDLLAAFIFLLRSGWPDCRAVLVAHRDFHREKHRYRHDLNTSKSLVNLELSGIYKNSILFDYYLRNEKKFSDLKNFRP